MNALSVYPNEKMTEPQSFAPEADVATPSLATNAPPPPPRRNTVLTPTQESVSTTSPSWETQPQGKELKAAQKKEKRALWKEKATQKAYAWNDAIGSKANKYAVKLNVERFWPVTNDAVEEIEKCARIVQSFSAGVTLDPDGKSPRKALAKIPPSVLAKAKGVCIFTSFRTGIAPLGGAGGAGVVMARLEDGSWSAPSFLSPNNLSGGWMLGLDVYDCVFVINSQRALESFYNHKVTLGAELAVVAGPIGAGAAVESGIDRAPLLSYVKSKGLYAGVEAVAQVFVERKDENQIFYNYPGIKAKEILSGGVRMPPQVAVLHSALLEAERRT